LAAQIDELQDLQAKITALKRRIQFLEWRLKQREETTRKDFALLKPYFESMRQKIMEIFYEEIPVTQGLSHPEIQEFYAKRHPGSSTTDCPRRVRELVDQDKLWRFDDRDGTARFYLKLKEAPEEKKDLKGVPNGGV